MNPTDTLAPIALQVLLVLGLVLLVVELVAARRRAVRRRQRARRAHLLASGYRTHQHSHVTLLPPPTDPPRR